MTTTLITEAQKAVLNAAASGGGKSRASFYPPPTVQPVDRFGVLHPDTTGVDNVEIVVDYDGMPNNDILFFYWNGDLSIPSAVADTKPKRVSVPAALVIAAANKTINVIYSVVDDNNPDGVPSEIHTLLIDKYTPPVYPAPVITEAVNGVLDVGALTRNANVTVLAWPGIAVGQKIWLSMVSTPPVTLTHWVGFPITNTGAQSTTISLDKLKTLVDGSTIALHFEVSFDGGLTKVPFPTATYTIKQVQVEVRPVIKSVTGPGGPVDNGGTTTDTSLTLTGTAAAKQKVVILDGATVIGTVGVDISGHWTLPINGLSAGGHSYTARGQYGNEPVSSPPWTLTKLQAVSGIEQFNESSNFSLNIPVHLASGLTGTLIVGSLVRANVGYLSYKYEDAIELKFELNGISTRVDISMQHEVYSTPPTAIKYFDAKGVLLGTQTPPLMSGGMFTTVSFTAPAGQSIASVNWSQGRPPPPPSTQFPGVIDYIRWYA